MSMKQWFLAKLFIYMSWFPMIIFHTFVYYKNNILFLEIAIFDDIQKNFFCQNKIKNLIIIHLAPPVATICFLFLLIMFQFSIWTFAFDCRIFGNGGNFPGSNYLGGNYHPESRCVRSQNWSRTKTEALLKTYYNESGGNAFLFFLFVI